jgi:hypothetical protein
VNSVIKASVVLQHFIRIREGLFCEGAENYAVNQSSYFNDDDDDGMQQRLQNQLADYFLTPVGAIPSQWSYIH